MAVDSVRIIVFSDDAERRSDVMNALGTTVGSAERSIEFTEIATGAMAMEIIKGDEAYDLVILDGETAGFSGIGLGKMMHDEVTEDHPNYAIPTINIVARPQDEWLSRWAGASRTLYYPLDANELATAVEELVEA